MKRFLPIGVVIVALLVILFVVRRCTQSSASGYLTATVTRGAITQLVTATGTLNPVVNVQVGSQVSGNIAKLFADFNSEVKAGQTVAQIDPMLFQAPVIFQIANDLTKMQIDSNVAEADVGAVSVNQDVDFTVDAFPTRTFHGKVVQVRNAPITVQNVVTYDTVIGVNNADLKLKPGMTANVSIVIAHKDDVLKISNAALRYRPANAPTPERSPAGQNRGGAGGCGSARPRATSRTVYVLRGGEAQPVQIKTGISDGTTTEVLEGLADKDRVITGQLNAPNAASPPQQGNPFGGPRRFP